MRIYARALVAALLCSAGTVAAESANEPLAAKFGALEAIGQASLSPAGDKVAYVADAVEGTRVYVATPSQPGVPREVMRMARDVGRITGCAWTGSARIVCRVAATVKYNAQRQEDVLVQITRLFAVNADGSETVQLTREGGIYSRGFLQYGGSLIDLDVPGEPGTVLMAREFQPDDRIGSLIGKEKGGLGVEQLDTVSLKRTVVERPRENAVGYITDGNGTIRLLETAMTNLDGYDRGKRTYLYRKANDRTWQELSTVDQDGRGFLPVAVDGGKNVAYGFDNEGDYQVLYTLSLDGLGTRTKVLGREGIDVDRLITIGRQDRVVGVSYATERRQVEYFDPQLASLAKALGGALPGKPHIDIVDASEDESKLLIVASSDTQPGTFYLFDKASKKLGEILPARPDLAGVKLAPMQPVTFPAADGTSIPGYLTLPLGGTGKNLPAIIMPHGGPSARDEWGFDWLVQYFAARGYAVLQPNYRGSAGYGSQFYQKNGFQSWRTAIGDVNDAGRWLVSQGIASPGKLGIVGWSYGGYAALQSQVLDPALYKAVVAVAPVTDLAALKDHAEAYNSGNIVARFVGSGPHVREGSPAQNAAAFTAPVLMFSGDKDLNVDIDQPRLMKRALENTGKRVTLIEFPGLGHSLSDPAARTRVLAESDAFLRKTMGIAP